MKKYILLFLLISSTCFGQVTFQPSAMVDDLSSTFTGDIALFASSTANTQWAGELSDTGTLASMTYIASNLVVDLSQESLDRIKAMFQPQVVVEKCKKEHLQDMQPFDQAINLIVTPGMANCRVVNLPFGRLTINAICPLPDKPIEVKSEDSGKLFVDIWFFFLWFTKWLGIFGTLYTVIGIFVVSFEYWMDERPIDYNERHYGLQDKLTNWIWTFPTLLIRAIVKFTTYCEKKGEKKW